MELPKEMYVVIVERDISEKYLEGNTPEGPMVWETYLVPERSSLEAARAQAKRIGDSYGETKIAKLEIIE